MHLLAARPRSAVVVGAGVIGLSVAWFLQDQDVEVTVVDRSRPGAGASWANAGLVSPGLTMPLGDPSVLAYGLRALASRDAALRIPVRFDPALWSFLARFAAHSTRSAWVRAASHLQLLTGGALAAFDLLATGGVTAAPTRATPFPAVFRDKRGARQFVRELGELCRLGGGLSWRELPVWQARGSWPQLADTHRYVMELHGQRWVDPACFVTALAKSVTDRGGFIRNRVDVQSIRTNSRGVLVESSDGEEFRGDVTVLATGAWLRELARSCGLRTKVAAGRGYSFSVGVEDPLAAPIYFPRERVVAVPQGDRMRLVGTMEFVPADYPLNRRRIDSIEKSVRHLLCGVQWEDRSDEWTGARPITVDSLPIVGAIASPRVFAAGGHGMWGLTLGPITGLSLASQITGADPPASLAPFGPR